MILVHSYSLIPVASSCSGPQICDSLLPPLGGAIVLHQEEFAGSLR